jgi:hypothetical protein
MRHAGLRKYHFKSHIGILVTNGTTNETNAMMPAFVAADAIAGYIPLRTFFF